MYPCRPALHPGKQNTRTALFLARMQTVIDWSKLVKIVGELDQNGTKKGCHLDSKPRK